MTGRLDAGPGEYCMVLSALTWCARVIAVITTFVLAAAAVLYVDAGESWVSYAAMVPAWGIVYFGLEWWLTRRMEGADQGRAAAARLGLALAGAALSMLSVGMAVRYALTPETLRQLDRATRRDSVDGSNGHRLWYYAVGDEKQPRLIYVHGTPGHAGVYADYLLDPVPGIESIAVDRLGFGRSATSGPVPSFEDQARAISALLVERDGAWPILVGHSLGGPIVARIAADYPDRVRGLVILAGSLDPSLETPSWYNDVTSTAPIDMKMPGLYDTSNSEIKGAGEQTRLLALVLGRVRCPVEVVHGTADTLVPVGNADYIKRSMVNSPHIGVTLIEGEGHGLHRHRGAEVRAAIARVIRESSRSGDK